MTTIEAEPARRDRASQRQSRCAAGCARSRATAPIAASPRRACSTDVIDGARGGAGRRAGAARRERESLTYRALAARANRYRALGARRRGLAKGETVCLLMPNRPEYLAIWLGITGVGRRRRAAQHQSARAFARPLHRHRRAEAHHRRRRTAPTHSRAHRRSLRAARRSGCTARTPAALTRIDRAIAALLARAADVGRAPPGDDRRSRAPASTPPARPDCRRPPCQPPPADAVEPLVRRHDGHAPGRPHVRLPADVSQRRRRGGDRRAAGRRRLGGDPRPVFGAALLGRHRRWDCTLFQYIGELCRYLVNAPAASATNAPIGFGFAAATGCGPTSGRSFRTAFVIPHILEFYAATEGNVSLYNVEGKPGAIGRIPPFLAHRAFRWRWCNSMSATGRAGARRARFLHPLRARTRPARRSGEFRAAPRKAANRFEGYTDRRRDRARKSCATCSRLATPGFAPAISCAWTQAAFSISSTGSATPSAGRARMSRPRKSPKRSRPFPASPKRTSTASRVPGTEGRAGMAAIVPDGGFDLAALRAHLGAAAAGLCAAAVPAHRRRSLRPRPPSSTRKNDLRATASIRPRPATRSISTIRRATLSCRSTRRCTSGSKPASCGFEPVACGRYRSAVCGEVGLISRGLLPKCDLKWRLNCA